MNLAAIILAAGCSTRFGVANKLLAPFEGAPMVSRVIQTAKSADIKNITVVIGHEAERIGEIAAGEGVSTCFNPDFAQGMASSLKAGVATLPAEVEGVLVLLGDMPLVRVQTICSLRDAATGNAPAFVPVYRGSWGNPVLIRCCLFERVMQLGGDQGARKLLASRDDICLVEVDDPGILADFDTRAALDALR